VYEGRWSGADPVPVFGGRVGDAFHPTQPDLRREVAASLG